MFIWLTLISGPKKEYNAKATEEFVFGPYRLWKRLSPVP